MHRVNLDNILQQFYLIRMDEFYSFTQLTNNISGVDFVPWNEFDRISVSQKHQK